MQKALNIIAQIALLIIFSWAMNLLIAWLHLPIPGSILGMLVLFVLLQTKVVRSEWLEAGSNWLIAELLLFFVSPAVGIIGYRQLLVSDGWRIALIVALGTIVVMMSSGWVAQAIAAARRKESARP